MHEEKISIIIPVYNAEKTIDRCLESICNQTYKNVEIIAVNDGSKDATLQKLEEWAEKDGRIIIISQENKGAAAARNKGLECMTGEYFAFVDADDSVDQEIYERLYNAAKSYTADIVSASIREIYNGDIEEKRINNEEVPILAGVEAACNLLKYEGGIRTVVWDKLFSAKKYKDVQFNADYVFGEDTLFNFEAMMKCKRYARISYIGYTYDHRQSQVTGKKYNSKKLSNIYVAERIEEIYKQSSFTDDTLEKSIKQFQVTICRQVMRSLLLEGDYKGQHKKDYEIMKKFAKHIDQSFVKKFLGKKDYIQWKLFIYSPMAYKMANKINHIK